MTGQFLKSDSLRKNSEAIFGEWRAIISREIPYAKIEHIGSTSITGALTKGDIDLYVEVAADRHSSAVNALENLGFRIKADTHQDTGFVHAVIRIDYCAGASGC